MGCNLIFQKFFTWSPWGIYTFEISVGILPYPITFLVTDIISEIYGRKKANDVVLAGLVTSVFILMVVLVAKAAPATGWSPINDVTFEKVFGMTGVAVGASMAAYLFAQYVDIRVFHFWKKLTKGRHLWLRNNASTITSQLIDTFVILLLLCWAEVVAWSKFYDLFINGFLFKIIIALFDTPLFYLFAWVLRKRFGLATGEELKTEIVVQNN